MAALILIIAVIIFLVKASSLSSQISLLKKQIADLHKHLGLPPPRQNPYAAPAPPPQPGQPEIPAQINEPFWSEPTPAPAVMQAKVKETPQEISTPKAAPVKEEEAGPSYFADMSAGKIFSWIGGLLLFLGVIFAIKYAFENNLISAQARIITGVFFGLALVSASFFIKAEKFKITSDTLCAAGLAVLYGVIFSSKYFYDFLSPTTAFFMMGGVSLASFWLALLKKAQYIGYLGVITGFLTPVILSTGSQNYLMLFAYLAFINIGAIGAGLKEGWDKLIFTALGFTLLFQFVWFYPSFSPSKITDFCIIFAAYACAAAAAARLFREKLSEDVKLSFGLYIAGSFLFIFLTDFSLPAIGLAFFMNLLLAALFYGEAKVYNMPFRIVNIAAFLLLASWLCSAGGKAQNGILLLAASLIFTALNTLVSASRSVKEDSFTAALPAAALLLLFFMPGMNLWVLYTFGFVFAAAAMVSAFRAGNETIAYFVLFAFGLFLIRGAAFTSYDFGVFELIAGMLYAAGVMSALAFGGFLPGKSKGPGIAAAIMPYVFLTAFILKNPSQEMLGLIFCAGISAVILVISCFNKNKYYPVAAAAGAFFPQIIAAGGGPVGLNEYTVPYVIIWALFFAYPFAVKDEDSPAWLASVLAGAALLVVGFINYGYINITAAAAFIAIFYGAAAFWLRGKGEKADLFAALAWIAVFIFINVQIAHHYTPGEKLVFETDGNLAKTVAYTLAWGVYGMFTLFASIGSRGRYGVFAGIGLVGVALAKLFLSDVWMLSTAYRVVIFIGMAVILIAGSFFYQALTAMLKKPKI